MSVRTVSVDRTVSVARTLSVGRTVAVVQEVSVGLGHLHTSSALTVQYEYE